MLIGFKKQFAHLVEFGEKTQTIRVFPKRVPKIGETAYLYTGLRTKQCRCLGEGKIESLKIIYFDRREGRLVSIEDDSPGLKNGQTFDLTDMARADGFSCWEEMRDWFEQTHGLPFEGLLIKWTDFRRV